MVIFASENPLLVSEFLCLVVNHVLFWNRTWFCKQPKDLFDLIFGGIFFISLNLTRMILENTGETPRASTFPRPTWAVQKWKLWPPRPCDIWRSSIWWKRHPAVCYQRCLVLPNSWRIRSGREAIFGRQAGLRGQLTVVNCNSFS